jgi:outer membrane protein OmpA-like peptidoglycan-associated protein
VTGGGATQPSVAEAPVVVRKDDPRASRQAEIERRLREGTRFVLEDVVFAGRTAVLAQEQGLTDLSRALAALPLTSIRLEVFVDATEDPNEDLRTSMTQAMAVVRKLVAFGIGRERIAQEARGGAQPVVPNFTFRGRATNRRVEVVSVHAR